jgi:predicted nucleotidyltransferase
MNYGLNDATIKSMQHVFRNHAKIQQVILYGSRALGTYKHGSDVDLTLVAPECHTKDLLHIETELDDLLMPYQLDLSLYHQIDNPDLLNHIARVGLVFYSRDPD